MPEQLKRKIVAKRLNNYLLDNYLYIGSFMKSVVFAMSTYVLFQIVIQIDNNWPRLLPWLVSLLATLVTHMTWGRGILLTNSRGNVWDSVFPLLMGIAEFGLFFILSPVEKQPNLWQWWFFVLAIHAFLAVGLVHNRIGNTQSEDFSDDLQDLAREYQTWMFEGRKGALIATVLAAFLGWFTVSALPCLVDGIWYAISYWILTVPFIIIFLSVIRNADRQRQRMDQLVFSACLRHEETGD